MAGSLFVVATPIGNLEDLTFRALRTLKEVDLIAAEDTRRTSKLLAHYGVAKPLVSLHDHNEYREAARLVSRMTRGESVALVSDAGTPGISDPGARLVRLTREAGLHVVPIPGASAVTAALSVSGLPVAPFTFLGFPPSSGQAREHWLESLPQQHGVLVFFEAPHRIERTLSELGDYLVKRDIFVTKEISKINEQFVKWNKNQSANDVQILSKGEFVVLVGPDEPEEPKEIDSGRIFLLFEQISNCTDIGESGTITAISALTGISAVRITKIIKKERILVKRQITKSS